jgi:hypothetical protein
MGGCPWCNAPRAAGPTCPRCGANYAKAELIKTQGRAQVAAVPVEEPVLAQEPAIAATIVGMMQRIVFGMPIHELGHAVSAWFCGFWAIPTLMFRAWQAEKLYLVVIGAVLLVVQAIGTFFIRESTAEAIFTFGGDGMGMVLAAALMATFFFGKRTQLYKGWLRWGFVCIGAAALSDMFATWWVARNDFTAIPFGEIEGVGLSDSLRLVQEHGWTEAALVRRYVTVGVSCLAALALVYAWGVRLAWRKAKIGSAGIIDRAV